LEHEEHEGSKAHQGLSLDLERLGRIVLDAGLKVHRSLGPGLLESVHEHCLAASSTFAASLRDAK